MNTALYPITRDQFEKVRPVLEANRKRTRPRTHDLYIVLCAVLYREQSQTSWRDLPDVFPPWRTIHEYRTMWTMPPADGGIPLLERVKLALEAKP